MKEKCFLNILFINKNDLLAFFNQNGSIVITCTDILEALKQILTILYKTSKHIKHTELQKPIPKQFNSKQSFPQGIIDILSYLRICL